MVRIWSRDEMWSAESAAASGGAALVAFFADHEGDAVLQTAGDAVLRAVRAVVPGAEALGLRWVGDLADRGWPGDAELAAQLEAAAGRGPVPLLRAVPVELADVAAVLEDDSDDGVVVDVSTGEWAFDDDEDVDVSGDSWVHLVPFGRGEPRLDVAEFERTFGMAPSREPTGFEWFVRERGLGRARAALAEAGLRPA